MEKGKEVAVKAQKEAEAKVKVVGSENWARSSHSRRSAAGTGAPEDNPVPDGAGFHRRHLAPRCCTGSSFFSPALRLHKRNQINNNNNSINTT